MPHRLASIIGQKILLGDVGDVFGLIVLGEQMIERLIFVWADLRRDRLVPFLGVVEDGIDIEDDTAKRKQAVFDHLADLKFGDPELIHGNSETTQLWRAAGN
jgi:hypothetical protein